MGLEWYEKAFVGIFLTLVAFVFVILFVYLPVQLKTEEECRFMRWPDASVTWNLHCYCGREVERTYYLVTIQEARAGAKPRLEQ